MLRAVSGRELGVTPSGFYAWRRKSQYWETERTTRQGLRPEPQPERRTR